MEIKKRCAREDKMVLVNLAIIIGGIMVTGLLMYLREHLEWSWH